MLEPLNSHPVKSRNSRIHQQEIWAEMADGPSVNPAVNRCMRACNRAAKKTRAELGTSEEAEFIVAKRPDSGISAHASPRQLRKRPRLHRLRLIR